MSDALISDCGNYRYWLRRRDEELYAEKGTAVFVMLNPSTADANIDDPTIRRCKGFAKTWGCNGISVINLYAYRATKPADLWKADDPVGPENDLWIRKIACECPDIVCAWGANAKPDRVKQFCEIVKDTGARLWCLGTTKAGAPRHPLYIKADQKLIEFEPPHTESKE